MKENKLFVLTLSNETLTLSCIDLLVSKLSDKPIHDIVCHTWLVNAKRNLVKTECRGTSMLDDYAEVHPRLEPKGSNKSLPVKINAARLQQNKVYGGLVVWLIGGFVVLWFGC